MAFDFAQLGASNSVDSVLHPREIFSVLPNKDSRYQYPRDVQTEVWNQWFDRRNEKDQVLRMNTGGGKTVVGILLLKSCLNENKGPAVYISPDQYLTQQVVEEANRLGIEISLDPNSIRVLRGKAILVTTIRTLINGKSVFGTGDTGIKLPIGSLLIDDAHACLETTEAQFTLTADGCIFDQFLGLFRDDLKEQSETKFLEIENQERGSFMHVPFWAWQSKCSKVASLLLPAQARLENGATDPYTKDTRASVTFNYPLLKEVLPLCRCVIGNGKIEISPRVIPISAIPSFTEAQRRIVMSATLPDDGVLISHFDLSPTAISKSITPLTANDIGDRMILVPQELNTEFSDDDLKFFYVELAKTKNVVVIVPSDYRARFWSDVSQMTLNASNLEDGIRKLKFGHVGLVTLINKYDGIDLPKSACDVLVIDGLPDFRRAIDKLEEGILLGTEQILNQRLQRIEQGMGRGVRSNDDHCLVFLMGKTLTNFLFKSEAKERFSAATRAQLILSEKLAQNLYEKPISAIKEVAEQFLQRDKSWLSVSKGALVQIKYGLIREVGSVTNKQREAFSLACRNDFSGACKAINEALNVAKEDKVKGWLKQQLAEYRNFTDQVDAQVILRSAVSLNSRVTRPLKGIEYQKIAASSLNQAAQCAEYLSRNFKDGNTFIVEIDALLSEFIFQPDASDRFEETVKTLGFVLGFRGQRPEDEFGQGPDVLWQAAEQTYFVIECKNGVTSNRPICKHDCNQLNGSVDWFSEKYGASCTVIPLMIHPQFEHEYAATLKADVRIITLEKIEELRQSIRQFARAIAPSLGADKAKIASSLQQFKLTKDLFANFAVKPRRVNQN